MNALLKALVEEFADKEYAHAYMEEFQNMLLAGQIKALREQRGWTQEELAQVAGMKQARISKLENAEYDSWTLATLRKLAEAFDVTVKVSFEEFSKAIVEIVTLKKEKLARIPREEDLARFFGKVSYPEQFTVGVARTTQTLFVASSAIVSSNDSQWHSLKSA